MHELGKEINNLLKEIKQTVRQEAQLPSKTYFLKNNRVLCLPREDGVSRFPYGQDGFTLWAYSSGYISINESTFYLVLPSEEGKEPYLGFFGGELDAKGKYVPISILGRAYSYLDDKSKRYCVYGRDCVYYITQTPKNVFAVRMFVTKDKKVIFDVYAKHLSKKMDTIYLSSYMNCLFKYANGESLETKWFKKCSYEDDRFFFESPEDINRVTHIENYGCILREEVEGSSFEIQNTTSKMVYMGGKENSLSSSSSLREGCFSRKKYVTHFTDMAIEGDLLKYQVGYQDEIVVHYAMVFSHSIEEMNLLMQKQNNEFSYTNVLLNNIRDEFEKKDKSSNMLKISFEDWKTKKINTAILNQFLKFVIYQTEYCGLAKNSGALFLGVRDVMQQVEACEIWNKEASRSKILEVLSNIDSTGNPPRQYSIPPKGSTPLMDLRDFIDQGVWIINTVYAYLAFTNDYSLLKEEIGYYDRLPANGVQLSPKRDSVLEHLKRIMDYLTTHIDSKTMCLRAMYGDWNDALDGLGISPNKGEKYGNGVSVMATLQLYQNLLEMKEILLKVEPNSPLIQSFDTLRSEIQQGILQNAIVTKDGTKRIVHGWGQDQSYYVGSFNDCDHKSRYSLTANAFYVISHMYENNYIPKADLLASFKALDSKYGLKTFEPYFEENCPGVGRIVHLPKGTAENGATYIHGGLFGTLALLMLNEGEFAYSELEKLLPITHTFISTSPFVMPNSYSYNEDEDMDGESMSDWYTGSANTLLKTILKGTFGVTPKLDGLGVAIRNYYPSRKASISFKYKNTIVEIRYEDQNKGRTILVNNNETKEENLFFSDEILKNNRKLMITILD